MLDLLLTGARVIDGSGAPPFAGDIGVVNGKIAFVRKAAGRTDTNGADAARQVIDLAGKIAAPGFIDIHRHGDAALFRPGFGEAELRQGITTVVNGCCGMNAAPLPQARRQEILAYIAPVTGGLPAEAQCETFSGYVSLLKSRPLPLNAATLAGSGTIRAAVMGYGSGSPSAEDLKNIHAVLEDALAAGALGVSIGLSYLPDAAYRPKELAAALAPLGGGSRPLVCHVRGEGDLLYESVAEVIEAAGLLNIPLHISHFKCIGRRNWRSLTAKVIGLIEQTREGGMTINCDAYPWTAGSTQMLCLLPPAFCEGGNQAAAQRLRDPAQRAACREILLRPGKDFENIVYGVGWESIFIAGLKSEQNQSFIGKNVAEIAALRGCDPYDAAFDLLAEENCDITMVDYITCEDDIDTIIRLPYTSIISDALYSEKSRPHPRNVSTIPQIFHTLVQGRRTLSLEQAIHKITGLPAEAMSLAGKGLLRPGYDADITVFSPEHISAPADYISPERLADGFDYVFIAGVPALEKDTLSGKQAGRFIGWD
jgi:N-acyl-D-aspartate/D-glutamate deacylase